MHFSTAFIAALAATATMVMAIPVANAEGGLVLRVPHDDIKREPQRDGQQTYIKREPQRDGQQAYTKREPQRDGQQAYIKRTPENFAVIEKLEKA